MASWALALPVIKTSIAATIIIPWKILPQVLFILIPLYIS
jgi:hypothetical protein